MKTVFFSNRVGAKKLCVYELIMTLMVCQVWDLLSKHDHLAIVEICPITKQLSEGKQLVSFDLNEKLSIKL